MRFLDHNPFPVEAHFEKSLVLGFAVPKGEVASRLPTCLEPDLLEEKWAFVAVAMVKTRRLRPKGFPEMFGRDFILIGYRIFVRYRGADGRRLRGLYILGSETDSRFMSVLGGVFTRYGYTFVSIDWTSNSGGERVSSSQGLMVSASTFDGESSLPEGSPFSTWKEARRFAGPMPFTFSYDKARREVGIVEGVRDTWSPVPMSVGECEIPFLASQGLGNPTLANAFLVENVPYHWKKGRVESWKG